MLRPDRSPPRKRPGATDTRIVELTASGGVNPVDGFSKTSSVRAAPSPHEPG